MIARRIEAERKRQQEIAEERARPEYFAAHFQRSFR